MNNLPTETGYIDAACEHYARQLDRAIDTFAEESNEDNLLALRAAMDQLESELNNGLPSYGSTYENQGMRFINVIEKAKAAINVSSNSDSLNIQARLVEQADQIKNYVLATCQAL